MILDIQMVMFNEQLDIHKPGIRVQAQSGDIHFGSVVLQLSIGRSLKKKSKKTQKTLRTWLQSLAKLSGSLRNTLVR